MTPGEEGGSGADRNTLHSDAADPDTTGRDTLIFWSATRDQLGNEMAADGALGDLKNALKDTSSADNLKEHAAAVLKRRLSFQDLAVPERCEAELALVKYSPITKAVVTGMCKLLESAPYGAAIAACLTACYVHMSEVGGLSYMHLHLCYDGFGAGTLHVYLQGTGSEVVPWKEFMQCCATTWCTVQRLLQRVTGSKKSSLCTC